MTGWEPVFVGFACRVSEAEPGDVPAARCLSPAGRSFPQTAGP